MRVRACVASEKGKKIAVRINGAWIPLLVFMDVILILLFLLCFHLSLFVSLSHSLSFSLSSSGNVGM